MVYTPIIPTEHEAVSTIDETPEEELGSVHTFLRQIITGTRILYTYMFINCKWKCNF